MEVRFDGEWYRGRLVELVSGSDVWGVAFDDGDWAEDVRLEDPDVRYVFAGGGVGGGRSEGGKKMFEWGKVRNQGRVWGRIRRDRQGQEDGEPGEKRDEAGARQPVLSATCATRHSQSPASWLHTCGAMRARGCMSARRAARHSQSPKS